jgi:hypothetical protein
VGPAGGIRIVPDDQSNSLVVGGSPAAVEAALVSGVDVAPEAAARADAILSLTADGGGVRLSMKRGGRETRINADRFDLAVNGREVSAEGAGTVAVSEPDGGTERLLHEAAGSEGAPYLADLPVTGSQFRRR